MAPTGQSTVSPLRILLVEDDFSAAEALRRLIRRAGHDVQLAASLAEVRSLPPSAKFDLLISDFNLTDGNGSQILPLVASAGLVAVALSGSTDESEVVRLREAGFAYYFSKPVDWPELRALIDNVSRERQQRQHQAGLPGQ